MTQVLLSLSAGVHEQHHHGQTVHVVYLLFLCGHVYMQHSLSLVTICIGCTYMQLCTLWMLCEVSKLHYMMECHRVEMPLTKHFCSHSTV